MNCTACGEPLVGGAAFCNHCGAPSPPRDSLAESAGVRMLLPVGRSGYAIAAGYAGLISIGLFPLGFVAIVLAILALRDMKRHPDRHGKGRAWFALVTGSIASLLTVAILVAVLASH